MGQISSFNYNFSSKSMSQNIKSSYQVQAIRSFSKDFNSSTKLKSNVQKRNNTTTIVRKKSA